MVRRSSAGDIQIQVGYDPASNRYFLPTLRYVTRGIAAASRSTSQMGVIDGASRQLLFKIPVRTGVHSVAIDSFQASMSPDAGPACTIGAFFMRVAFPGRRQNTADYDGCCSG